MTGISIMELRADCYPIAEIARREKEGFVLIFREDGTFQMTSMTPEKRDDRPAEGTDRTV